MRDENRQLNVEELVRAHFDYSASKPGEMGRAAGRRCVLGISLWRCGGSENTRREAGRW